MTFSLIIPVNLEYVITEVNKDVLTLTTVDSGKVYSFVADKAAATSSSAASSSDATSGSVAA